MSKLSETSTTKDHSSAEFSPDERRILLNLAHQSILLALDGHEFPHAAPSSHLQEMRGVFTTLYLHSRLRGCVGYARPIAPLYRAVAETARAAAFDDSRFWPVTKAEAPDLEISLSVLSPLFPIRADEIEVGRHGLVVSMGSQRGLLLPQVPMECGWDRETFLAQTCHKAGLRGNAWLRGAMLEAFTAEVFGDNGIS